MPMTPNLSSAARIASWLGRSIGATQTFFGNFSTTGWGIEMPPAVLQPPQVAGALTTAAAAAGEVADSTSALEAAAAGDDELGTLAAFLTLGEKINAFITAVKALGTAIRNAIDSTTVPGAAARAAAENLAVDFLRIVLDHALATAITYETPRFGFLLTLLGLMEWEFVPADPANPISTGYVKRILHLDRLRNLIRDPKTHLADVYRWGKPLNDPPLFDPSKVLRLASEFYPPERALDLGVEAGEPFLRIGAFRISRDTSVDPARLALAFGGEANADLSRRRALSDEWGAELTSKLRFSGEVGGFIAPPLTFSVAPVASGFDGELTLLLDRNPDARPFSLLSGSGVARISAENASAGFSVVAHADLATHAASFEPVLFAEVEQGKIAIAASSADGFLTSVLPSKGIEGEFDLRAEWRASSGLRLSGSGGLEIALPLHKQFGPLKVDTIYVALRVRDDGTLSLETSAAGGVVIGPVAVTIDRVGARLDLRFAADVGAKFGAFDLDLRFKPPSGLGFVINAGPLKGGGFLSFDEAEGRYSGVLQLQFKEIAIKAIGILDTKLPGGEKGYSFLLILTAEFAPIQLGMGFTLNGVGGLAGIHRTVAVPELQAGIRSHATDSVLFPKDPVKNAPRILSDLQRYFPRQKNHYIFGPMAIIGWGKPTLATIKLGIILEFPPPLRIVLLGQLDCKLPDATAVVDLHVDVLGVLDFGAQTFALDGTVHDSRIGPYSLSGDFAVRLKWGNAPTFALAIGGFHPAFRQIPVGFPSLRRMTLALSSGDNPRLTLQCYIALTSNSLQFGARAELYASASGFSVSGWIGFDVLIIFHPFGFRADLSAGFVLRRGSKNLGGIHVDATLTGPSPWHVWGEATISILFIDVTVSFDVTIGSGGPGALPSVVVWLALQTGLEEPGNWSGVLPVAAAHVVTVKKPGGLAGTIIDPVGTITLVERVAPLARRISRFADARPSGITRFDLQRVAIGTRTNVPHQYTQELFAPAQFEQLSDSEKLSRPSFERVAAGMELTDRVTVAGVAGTPITCRSVVFDSPFESHDGADYAIAAEAQVALADAGSNATGGIRVATQSYITPGAKPKVTLDDETYVIAAADDLKARLDIAPAGTKGAVFSALAEYLTGHADQRGSLTVVAAYEAEAA